MIGPRRPLPIGRRGDAAEQVVLRREGVSGTLLLDIERIVAAKGGRHVHDRMLKRRVRRPAEGIVERVEIERTGAVAASPDRRSRNAWARAAGIGRAGHHRRTIVHLGDRDDMVAEPEVSPSFSTTRVSRDVGCAASFTLTPFRLIGQTRSGRSWRR